MQKHIPHLFTALGTACAVFLVMSLANNSEKAKDQATQTQAINIARSVGRIEMYNELFSQAKKDGELTMWEIVLDENRKLIVEDGKLKRGEEIKLEMKPKEIIKEKKP